MLNRTRVRLFEATNVASAHILRYCKHLAWRWLQSTRDCSSPLYDEYIEGMLSDYVEIKTECQQQGFSETRILLRSLPWGYDIARAVLRLTIARFFRSVSLMFYGVEQLMVLSGSSSVSLGVQRIDLRTFVSFLHRVTGSVGKTSTQGMLQLDSTAHIVGWEPEAEALFGFTAEEALGREAIGTFIPTVETGGRMLTNLISEICATPTNYSFNINENQCKTGERFWVFWINVPLFNPGREQIEVACLGIQLEDPEPMKTLVRLWQTWKGL